MANSDNMRYMSDVELNNIHIESAEKRISNRIFAIKRINVFLNILQVVFFQFIVECLTGNAQLSSYRT